MNQKQAEAHNMQALREFRDKHGDAALERLGELIRKLGESFPDPTRAVVWVVDVDDSGEITVDVRP